MAQNQRGGTAGRHRAGAGNDRTNYRTEREYGNTAGGPYPSRPGAGNAWGSLKRRAMFTAILPRSFPFKGSWRKHLRITGLATGQKNRDKAKHMAPWLCGIPAGGFCNGRCNPDELCAAAVRYDQVSQPGCQEGKRVKPPETFQ